MSDTPHQAHRVIFIDLARAAAVIMMVYGHTVSALLALEYRVGVWHDIWVFQRGLTSSLFLLLSGFAFSIATTRRWPQHTSLSPAVLRRFRRFLFYVCLGYGMHYPATSLATLAQTSDERWHAFLAVDVLQLIGVTFIGVQLLVLLTRRRRLFAAATFVLAAAVLALSPWTWSIDWTTRVPLAMASYFSTATGSLFPLFPWASFVLIGAGLGQVYSRWGGGHLQRFANRAMLAPGVVLLAAVLAAAAAGRWLLGTGRSDWIVDEMVVRIGCSLVLLSLVAHASRFIDRLPYVFGAVAQESLLVYFVHLCIIYGSIWNPGLQGMYAESLAPLPTVLIVLAMIAAMVGLAWQWNTFKHAYPLAARRVALVAIAGLLVHVVA